MNRPSLFATLVLPVLAVAAVTACGGDDSGRRIVRITQTDEACMPEVIEAKAGEKLRFEVKNEGKKDHEVEGIDGTRLEELLVPAGRTRRINYTVPGEEGVRKIKCYIPGGSATIIEVRISGSAASGGEDDEGDGGGAGTRVTTRDPLDTIRVRLSDYKVEPDRTKAATAGPIRFIAENVSRGEVHELAVLRVLPDGGFENTGEVENLDAGATGEITLDLPPGKYVLACLIVPGQAGSKVDHFAEGMKLDFEVP